MVTRICGRCVYTEAVKFCLAAGFEEQWLRSPSMSFTIKKLSFSKPKNLVLDHMELSVRLCVTTCLVLQKSSTVLSLQSLNKSVVF